MRSFIRKTHRAGWLGALVPLLFLAAAGLGSGCGEDDVPPLSDGGNGPKRPPVRGGSGGDGGDIGTGGTGGIATGGSGGMGGAGVEVRVDDVRPPRGSLLGGETVIINGAGFVLSLDAGSNPTDSTEVFFGANRAVGARVIDDDTILATTPPGAEGDVDVVINNPKGSFTCAGCYRFQAAVELHGIEPTDGSIHGGTLIHLRGEHLRPTMKVLVGSRAALDVQGQADGSLVAVLPPGDIAGPVDVRVFDADGQASLRKAFTYVAPLAIDELDPPGGPLGGGNTIRVEGTGFTDDAAVYVGGTLATSSLQPDGTLEVTMPPAASAGGTGFEVRTSAGSAFADYGYFDPAETAIHLYALSPASGPVGGGTVVTLVGANLDRGGLALRFGGILAGDAVATGPHFVRATVPAAAAAGPVDIDLRVTGGADTLVAGYRYVDSIDIHSVSPGNGPVGGGTTITIRGEGFPVGARVFVGAFEARAVEWLDGRTLRAVTPTGTDGPVPVRVVDSADAANEGILKLGFVFDGPFDVARIDPVSGGRAGGARVIARGSGFRPGLAASFASIASTSVEVIDSFSAVLVAPRGEVGTVDVTVDSVGGDQVRLSGAFTYFDPTNAHGGASGGPVNGTLNVTVLDGGNARNGVPLPNVLVILGTDGATPHQGLTDSRGQITFSDSTLVKAQVVSTALQGYQSTTVVNQASENLTILMRPNFEPAQCENGLDDDGDGLIDSDDIDGCMCGPANSPRPDLCMCPQNKMEAATCCDGIDNDGDGLIDAEDPDCQCSGGTSEGPLAECSNCIDDDGDGRIDYFNPQFPPDSGCANAGDDERGALVAGKIWGFKLPGGRTLGENEVEEAQIRVSVPNYYAAPPFGGPQGPIIRNTEGSTYAYEFPSTRLMAIYAVYGIRNIDTNDFEPLLMGVRRNVNARPGNDITNADIVLDTHLSMNVPVTIDNPPSVLGNLGASTVYAYMDLGAEGVIPVGQAATTLPHQALLEKLPALGGESFTFQLWGGPAAGVDLPFTASFRRQAGDISNGITIGPLMGLPQLLQPTGRFEGVIEWRAEPGPPAEVTELRIDEPTLAGMVLQWQMIVPGSENRVAVPPAVLQQLRAKYLPGTQLQLTIIRGREPRFSYEQWNYRNLSLDAFTSFTYDVQLLML